MRVRSMMALIIGVLGFVGTASAADPLEVAPHMYSKNFENDRVRVMTVVFQPGQSIPEHSHPDHFVYVVETGTLKITKSTGEVTELSPNVGDVLWLAAETHAAVNIGTTPIKILVVELK